MSIVDKIDEYLKESHDEMMICDECGWEGKRSELKDDCCPKCGVCSPKVHPTKEVSEAKDGYAFTLDTKKDKKSSIEEGHTPYELVIHFPLTSKNVSAVKYNVDYILKQMGNIAGDTYAEVDILSDDEYEKAIKKAEFLPKYKISKR